MERQGLEETLPLPKHQPRRCCSTLKLVRKSRTSNNKPSWLALYARRALTPVMLLTSLLTTINGFYFRMIVGVGRDEIEKKHKFRHTPIENGRYTRLITLLPSQRSESISCVLQAIAIDYPASYTALSYKWGSALKQKTVKIFWLV